jgi:flagellar hook protein FlgE
MSLIGAFIAAVTGIDAQATKLDAISDNISNANTVGYKPTEINFQTLVAPEGAPTTLGSTGPVPFNYTGGGVTPVTQQLVSLQGLLTSTSSSTDMAISGNGFFAVTPVQDITGSGTSATLSQGAEIAVTRAGSFTLNANGLLVNSAGYALLGTPTGDTQPTSLSGLVPVAFAPGPTVTTGGAGTTQVTIDANLPADAATGTTEQLSLGAYDSSGNEYTLGVTFTNTGTNTWSAQLSSVSAVNSSSGITGTVSGSAQTLSFDSNGELTSTVSGSLGTITLSNGDTISPTFNFDSGATSTATGGMTQLGSQFAAGNIQQNGAGPGYRTGISIDDNGNVSEVYSNNQVIQRYQAPVVTYVNPDALEAQSGNVYLQTQASGTAAINASGTGGAGQIMPSELEQSSVDLASEFTNMIVSQSAYEANTKVVTTADQMYQTLTQLQ